MDLKTVIVSAYKLAEEEIKSIEQKFPFIKGTTIENKIDESILAGIIIRSGSKIVDISLLSKLRNLKKLI